MAKEPLALVTSDASHHLTLGSRHGHWPHSLAPGAVGLVACPSSIPVKACPVPAKDSRKGRRHKDDMRYYFKRVPAADPLGLPHTLLGSLQLPGLVHEKLHKLRHGQRVSLAALGRVPRPLHHHAGHV